MTNEDVLIEIKVSLRRDGRVTLDTDQPNGTQDYCTLIIIGALEAAKSMLLSLREDEGTV